MNNLNEYIIEKLKLNKDTEIFSNIKDKYELNKVCLLVIHNKYTYRDYGYTLIDAVKITKINPKSYVLKNLTHLSSNKDTIIFIPDDKQNNDWKFLLHSISSTKTQILIPGNESGKLLAHIIKEKSLSFYHAIKDEYKNDEPVYQLINDIPYRTEYLSNSSIKKIINELPNIKEEN